MHPLRISILVEFYFVLMKNYLLVQGFRLTRCFGEDKSDFVLATFRCSRKYLEDIKSNGQDLDFNFRKQYFMITYLYFKACVTQPLWPLQRTGRTINLVLSWTHHRIIDFSQQFKFFFHTKMKGKELLIFYFPPLEFFFGLFRRDSFLI